VVGGGGTELALATDLTVNGATRIVANDLSRENPSSIINVLLTNDGSIDLSGQTTYTRRLVTYSGSLSGGLNNGTYNAASNVFAVDGVNFDIANNWQIVIDTTNRTIDITFTPVPEPATILLAGTLGLAAVQVIRRRRHARTASPSPAV
jgi:hypothetical protein